MEARAILQSVENVKGFSSMRGTGGGIPGRWRATAGEWQRKHGEKGNFSPVEGFNSLR